MFEILVPTETWLEGKEGKKEGRGKQAISKQPPSRRGVDGDAWEGRKEGSQQQPHEYTEELIPGHDSGVARRPKGHGAVRRRDVRVHRVHMDMQAINSLLQQESYSLAHEDADTIDPSSEVRNRICESDTPTDQ